MARKGWKGAQRSFFVFLLVLLAVLQHRTALAAQLNLTWVDNSTNEDGFEIERRTAPNGTFAHLADQAANVTFYIDVNVTVGTTYCYRVRAFNAAGDSAYSNEACGTPVSPPPPEAQMEVRLGVFRPSTGAWYLDLNDNGLLDSCQVDRCAGPFGQGGDKPVAGDWTGSGQDLIGVFRPSQRKWYLDLNANGLLDNCQADSCAGPFGQGKDRPVVGRWTGVGRDLLGVFRPGRKRWRLDFDKDNKWDNCKIDGCLGPFGVSTDLPVAGDWMGTGMARIGVFDPQTGLWELDLNGNGLWDGCQKDRCLGPFGQPGTLPVVGDWTGTGAVRIGAFDPQTGLWELDLNGNGLWDGCQVDRCLGPFGQPGDLPVVGKW